MYFIKCILFLTIIFLGINDIILNRKRNKYLKILELLICMFFTLILFKTVIAYNDLKLEIRNYILNDTIFGTEMTDYNLDGTKGETITIGKYMAKHFIRNVYDGRTNITQVEYLKNNIIIIVVTCIYLVYWITLLLLFEKEEVSGLKIIEDGEIFLKR